MPATADRNSTAEHLERFVRLPLAAGTIFAGTMGAVNASGNAVPASDTAGLVVIGRVAERVVFANGDTNVLIERGVFKYKNSATDAVDLNDVGRACYVEDDQTVRETPGTNAIFAGWVELVESDGVTVSQLGGLGPAAQGGVQAISDSGAALPGPLLTTLAVTGTDAVTLADGTYIGQQKWFRVLSAASTPIVTITCTGSGFTTITMNPAAAQMFVGLFWTGAAWAVLANHASVAFS
jgi:hypothetical protein